MSFKSMVLCFLTIVGIIYSYLFVSATWEILLAESEGRVILNKSEFVHWNFFQHELLYEFLCAGVVIITILLFIFTIISMRRDRTPENPTKKSKVWAELKVN
jgi:hypothetical protein